MHLVRILKIDDNNYLKRGIFMNKDNLVEILMFMKKYNIKFNSDLMKEDILNIDDELVGIIIYVANSIESNKINEKIRNDFIQLIKKCADISKNNSIRKKMLIDVLTNKKLVEKNVNFICANKIIRAKNNDIASVVSSVVNNYFDKNPDVKSPIFELADEILKSPNIKYANTIKNLYTYMANLPVCTKDTFTLDVSSDITYGAEIINGANEYNIENVYNSIM